MACIQKSESESESEQHPQAAPTLFYAVDLPFSLLGDVVTWPYTAAYSYINQPIPVPPVIQAPPAGLPPTLGAPESKEPDKKKPEKDADKDKPRDDTPTQLPLPLPLPKEQTP
jgi:hypothetical protein